MKTSAISSNLYNTGRRLVPLSHPELLKGKHHVQGCLWNQKEMESCETSRGRFDGTIAPTYMCFCGSNVLGKGGLEGALRGQIKWGGGESIDGQTLTIWRAGSWTEEVEWGGGIEQNKCKKVKRDAPEACKWGIVDGGGVSYREVTAWWSDC